MQSNEYNNDFLGYHGYINRKNYAINLLILFALFFATNLVNFEKLTQFTNYELLKTVLSFVVDLFKFVLMISALSVVYRRLADISKKRPITFFEKLKKAYGLLFVFPVFYLYCFRYFLDIIPLLTNFLNILTIVVLIPLAIISTIVLCFIKGE
jgi:uncharacterized membrane protein YhaH (DUF805 family)